MAGPYVPQQLRGQHKAKENVDREHENEVRQVLAQGRPSSVNPIFDYPIYCLWSTQQVQTEPNQPFLIHVVDDGVCHLFRIFKVFGLPPMPQLTHNGLDHRRKIDGSQGSAPLPSCVTLKVQKFLLRPSFKRFLLRTSPKNDAFLVT